MTSASEQAAPLTAEEERQLRSRLGTLSRHDGPSTLMERRLLATLDRDRSAPSDGGLDVERLRLVLHAEYDHSGDRYRGCRHLNQHRSTWDCALRADELMAGLAATPTPAPDPMLGTPADGRHPDHACGMSPCPHTPAPAPADLPDCTCETFTGRHTKWCDISEYRAALSDSSAEEGGSQTTD